MKVFLLSILILCCLTQCNTNQADTTKPPLTTSWSKGKLFIIGGGDRTTLLMERMLDEAGFDSTCYIAVLPMSSEEPDSAFYYINQDIQQVERVRCVNLNFSEADIINEKMLAELRGAKIIFITGGDQNRFMQLVGKTPIEDAILDAYNAGAMIAGTSAGAAVMSATMISGDENFSADYASTYDKVWKGNGIYHKGLGLLNNTIIDQHFVTRSRYNRLISALCDFNGLAAIGIDEETAAIVSGNKLLVAGENQVVYFHPKDTCDVQMHRLGVRDIRMEVLLPGDSITLP